MEAYAPLIRAYGVVELYAIAEIGLHLSLIVGPGDAECHDTVRLDHTLDDTRLLKFGMLVVDIAY